jgi:hypothetical protein
VFSAQSFTHLYLEILGTVDMENVGNVIVRKPGKEQITRTSKDILVDNITIYRKRNRGRDGRRGSLGSGRFSGGVL